MKEFWKKIKRKLQPRPDEIEERLLEQIRSIGTDLETNYEMIPGTEAHNRAVRELIDLCNTYRDYRKSKTDLAKVLIEAGFQAGGTVCSAVIKATSNRRQLVDIYQIAKSGDAPIRKSDTNFL